MQDTYVVCHTFMRLACDAIFFTLMSRITKHIKSERYCIDFPSIFPPKQSGDCTEEAGQLHVEYNISHKDPALSTLHAVR